LTWKSWEYLFSNHATYQWVRKVVNRKFACVLAKSKVKKLVCFPIPMGYDMNLDVIYRKAPNSPNLLGFPLVFSEIT
jgi:hypothetical protein